MCEDTRGLIEEVRRLHRDGIDHERSVWGPWCYRCQAEYPCIPVRIANALESAERRAAEMEQAEDLLQSERDEYGSALETIETEVSEAFDNDCPESDVVETVRYTLAQLAALTRDLAAATQRAERLAEWARERGHYSHCPHFRYRPGKRACDPHTCGLDAALGLAAGEVE